MAFQTLQHKLTNLVARAASGAIALPDFQRGYVWDDERVRQLLVTIGVGHPLGVILMLETGSAEIHFESKPIEGTNPTSGNEPERLVLDGQQRLTSLTQALSDRGVVETSDNGARRYYIRVADAIKDPENLEEAIESLPATGLRRVNFNRDVALDVSSRDKEIAEGYFPVSKLLTDEATSWIMEWATRSGEGSEAATVFFDKIWSPIRAYTIPSIELDKQTTMDAVTTVFEKVNQGGVKLTVFELLTAKFAGDKQYFQTHGYAFGLRKEWENRLDRFEDFPVLGKFESDDFLQAVTLAASKSGPRATTAKKEDVLKLSLNDYLLWAPQVADGVVWAAKFLDSENIHTDYDIRTPNRSCRWPCCVYYLDSKLMYMALIPGCVNGYGAASLASYTAARSKRDSRAISIKSQCARGKTPMPSSPRQSRTHSSTNLDC